MEIKNIEIQDSDGNVFYPHTNASVVKATDTSGLDGIAGQSSDTQTLLDKLADRVANKLIEKGMIVDNFATQIKGFVPDATLVTDLNNRLVEQNNNIDGILNSKTILTDANNAIDGGSYYFNPTALNIPYKEYGMLSVRTACGKAWVYQEAVFHGVKHKFYRMNINDTGWSDWEMYITNNDMPVFESFIINPNGSTDITLTLSNNASSSAIFAVNGDINSFSGSILGVQIVHGTNQLRVLLSKSCSNNMRINVIYMRT